MLYYLGNFMSYHVQSKWCKKKEEGNRKYIYWLGDQLLAKNRADNTYKLNVYHSFKSPQKVKFPAKIVLMFCQRFRERLGTSWKNAKCNFVKKGSVMALGCFARVLSRSGQETTFSISREHFFSDLRQKSVGTKPAEGGGSLSPSMEHSLSRYG